MTRWPSLAGSFPWARARTAAATIIISTPCCAAVTAPCEPARASRRGCGRGRVARSAPPDPTGAARLAVVYNLLSISHNQRLRLTVRCPDSAEPVVDSVVDLWASANWFEREAFDLFGSLFRGHPDLRRILTDYGFIGHPFRKDFPLIGNVEVQYRIA